MIKVVLKKYLARHNITQKWLSAETGLTVEHINRICNGFGSAIMFDTLNRVCKALKCNIEDVIIYTEKE